jgi:outer membrane protein assembly factor BamB
MFRIVSLILVAALVARAHAASPALPVEGGAKEWPQAGGPNGSWSVEAGDAPSKWSLARNEGIVWRTALPEEGQSGIAVWGDRIFLTTLKPEEGKRPNGRDVVGYCLDARDGKILWTVPLPGSATSTPAYFFSDASSPTPVTDGRHVWFINACGSLSCYDFAGKRVWLREWKPTGGRPFNKLFEPILIGNTVLNMEPRDADDPKREKDPWNYIRGIDKLTGKTLWISDDAMTHYNTPVLGSLADGTPAVLQGRGGYHGVPETPIGLSLTSLAPGHEGKTIWRFETPTGKALYTQHFTAAITPWFDLDAANHAVLDSATGKVLRTQSLTAKVDWRRYDATKGKYELLADVDLSKQTPVVKVFPAQLCNILVGDWHWFLCYTEASKHLGPAYCVGRVNIESGKVEYLELPVSVVRATGKEDVFVWDKPQTSSTVNSRGIDIVSDKRSQGDGWYWGYLGSPTAVGGKIFFTTMLGITYAIDGRAAVLDEKALLSVNDLGTPGQTWSLNSISYARGHLFHRSMTKVVCIGRK